MTGSSQNVIVSPVGDIEPWISRMLADRLPDVFGFPAQITAVLDNIEFAYDKERHQYHSTPVLEALANRCPEHGVKILGVTRQDLFIPILTHVYGEAQLGGRAALVSVSRLIRGPDLGGMDAGRARILKEAVHELGHCFDLRHCDDPRCIMHYCRKIDDVDKKSNQFCRYCRIMLVDDIRMNPLKP